MKKKKVYSIIIGIDILQIVVGLIMLVYVSMTEYNPLYNYLILTIGVMLACGIALLVCFYTLGHKDDTNLLRNIRELENLNTTLRAQRHDYLNHFQVVYGLMELEEYEEARKYLAPVYKDILKVGKALKTSKPAVNALLQAKLAEAEQNGIDFYLEVRSDLSQLPMESWNLCKVLANILDNAMKAAGERADGEKKVEVVISESAEGYEFLIRNNGPQIPKEMFGEIFKQGVSTKKENGHGMGLYIVHKILAEHAGTVDISSTTEWTTFAVAIRKAEQHAM
ncbi:MAG: Spo0B domain-containing protein [Lachnospiraceae bacterium]|nr:Spo0B domain-containing protein [Lachnospiraceae bacterium]